jgi:hypothetical protein
MYSLALIIFVVSEKKAFEYFPIGSNVNLCPNIIKAKLYMNVHWMVLYKLYVFCSGMKSCRSRHFEFHTGTKNVKFVEEHLMNIHVQFGFNHICSF